MSSIGTEVESYEDAERKESIISDVLHIGSGKGFTSDALPTHNPTHLSGLGTDTTSTLDVDFPRLALQKYSMYPTIYVAEALKIYSCIIQLKYKR